MAKEGDYATLRLPSGEMRYVRIECRATVGTVSNSTNDIVNIGKAGRKRHMGWRPTVRGSVMNPCDHPHGGGEGRSPIGRPSPVTPWGKPALDTRLERIRSILIDLSLREETISNMKRTYSLHGLSA